MVALLNYLTTRLSCVTISAMESIRTFVAMELSDDLKHALQTIQHRLQDAPGARVARWVAPQNIHLTLKFLGEVESVRVPRLIAALQESSAGLAPFTLTARGLGCFPSTRRPNVIWVGLAGDVQHALELAQRIESACEKSGFPREARAFSPHLTIGRIKREARPVDRAAIGAAVQDFSTPDLGIIVGDAVHLIKSDLRPDGPIYTKLASIHLNTPDDPIPRPS